MTLDRADIVDRLWAGFVALAAAVVVQSSAVGTNLWFVSGLGADFLGLVYAAAMAFVAIDPDSINWHRLAAGLSVVFWGGRAAAFAELVIEGERWDLLGAVAERGAILAAVLTLHFLAARRIGLATVLREARARDAG